MSYDLYYRGSSTYEVAVKDKLDQLERTGTRNAMDMLYGLQNMEYGIRSDIRESTRAIVASQQYLAETFKNGFDSVNNTLQIGFEMMFKGMASINNSINAMNKAICDRLDAIHDIVNNPRLTAARELFRRASTNFEKGYFEEALEDCKQAVEKEKTDFISWYLLGQIYLFGAGKFSNVINLNEAENAFANAAKYIDADLGTNAEADELGGNIYLHLGISRWLLSNDFLVNNAIEESNKFLDSALTAEYEALITFENAYKKAPTEICRISAYKSLYKLATIYHFKNEDEVVLKLLKKLIKAEKNYALLATNDKNFESIWGDIEKVILELRDELVNDVKAYVNQLDIKIQNIIASGLSSKHLLGIKETISNKINGLENRDYIFVRATFNELKELMQELEKYKTDIESYNKSPDDFMKKKGFIPQGVTCIKELQEGSGLNLTKVVIPESVINIGYHAFYECKNLVSVVIPDGVTSIGDYAFSGCSKLTSIVIPASVTSIGDYAFAECSKLTECEIPASVKKMGKDVFICTPLGKKGGCYVATCVYGSYDCPQVWTLRRFRDNTLGSTWYGRLFIKTYYAVSPTLVKWFGETKWFKNMWKPTLDKMVRKLQSDGVESSPYEDKVWR